MPKLASNKSQQQPHLTITAFPAAYVAPFFVVMIRLAVKTTSIAVVGWNLSFLSYHRYSLSRIHLRPEGYRSR